MFWVGKQGETQWGDQLPILYVQYWSGSDGLALQYRLQQHCKLKEVVDHTKRYLQEEGHVLPQNEAASYRDFPIELERETDSMKDKSTLVYQDQDGADKLRGHSGLLWSCSVQNCTFSIVQLKTYRKRHATPGHEPVTGAPLTLGLDQRKSRRKDGMLETCLDAPTVTPRAKSGDRKAMVPHRAPRVGIGNLVQNPGASPPHWWMGRPSIWPACPVLDPTTSHNHPQHHHQRHPDN